MPVPGLNDAVGRLLAGKPNPGDEELVTLQIAIFLMGELQRPVPPGPQGQGRPTGGLRALFLALGYTDRQIDTWLWDGQPAPDGHFPPRISELSILLGEHLVGGTCDCADFHRHRRPDYYRKKVVRCSRQHRLAALPRDPKLRKRPNLFIWRAVLGGVHPLKQARGFIDSMLFPLLTTPGGFALSWKWVPRSTMIVAGNVRTVVGKAWITDDRSAPFPPGEVAAGAEARRSKAAGTAAGTATGPRTRPILLCPACERFIRPEDDLERCRRDKHLWVLHRLDLSNVLYGEAEIAFNVCPNRHVWHPDGGPRCPAPECAAPGERRSVPLCFPEDDDLFPETGA